MNKSYRVRVDTTSSDNTEIKVKLEQDIDTLEFLSMSLDTKEFYENFNADYGVLIGRVTANGGIGIRNAKISIFIPLSEEDENDSSIVTHYPYKTPRDKKFDGKRYNLLPRVGQFNQDGTVSPVQPFGSFPIKPEIITNPNLLKVHKKYYKYTATTNDSGDYMIFGVPTGVQTVHMSVDITDIGQYSMTPASMVGNLGYSPNLFTNNNTRIKESNDLDDLPHIETQEISVDVIPFWGDMDNFEIGFTRQDFRIRATLINTFTIFGTSFTDGEENMWAADIGDELRSLYRANGQTDGREHLSMITKRISNITEKIYYYPTEMSDSEIANAQIDDPEADNMLLLDPSEYSVFKRGGDFVIVVSCNRKKITIDEFGNSIEVDSSSPEGVFTEFKGFITFEYDVDTLPTNFTSSVGGRRLTQIRMRVKIPQKSAPKQSHAMYSSENNDSDIREQNNARWRHEHYTFKAGNIYSIAKFHGTVHNNTTGASRPPYLTGTGFFQHDNINKPRESSLLNSGLLWSEIDDIDENGDEILIDELPSNAFSIDSERNIFGANWLNFALHLPQVGYLNPRRTSRRYNETKTTTLFSYDARRNDGGTFPINENPFEGNSQKIAAGQINTAWFARSDLHWTDFIEVPKGVLLEIRNITNQTEQKGFSSFDLSFNNISPSALNTITQNFKSARTDTPNGEIPFSADTGAGRTGGFVGGGTDFNVYMYRGWRSADCLQFLTELNII